MSDSFKCPFCNRKYIDKTALYEHMENEHKEDLSGLPAAQIYFNFKNKYALTKGYGKSIISGKPTSFNITTERYERFADEQERNEYREMFKRRMMNKYGKETLLTDPEQQKVMLANRHISGKFIWDSGEETTYTGNYEKAFLQFLNLNYDWANPTDIMAPAPMIFDYDGVDGKKHFHIPDFYIQSLNLIVNIKSSTNMGYRLRDIENEKLQDEIIKKSSYNYIKIYDNKFDNFVKSLAVLSKSENNKKIYII